MEKDNRYKVVKAMIENGEIIEFAQIFHYIPKRVVVEDMHTSFRRITLLSGPELKRLELGDIHDISKLINVEMGVIYKLCERQYLSKKAGTGKKIKNKTANQ